jgi:hypothetical protein
MNRSIVAHISFVYFSVYSNLPQCYSRLQMHTQTFIQLWQNIELLNYPYDDDDNGIYLLVCHVF